MNNKKRTIKLIACLILIDVVLIIGNYNFAPKTIIDYNFANSDFIELGIDDLECLGYDVDGDLLIPNDPDPQIIINNINKKVSGIEIDLNKSINNCEVQVYYKTKNAEFGESNSVKTSITGNNKIVIKIPTQEYQDKSIRIDINDTVSIDKIKLFENEPETLLENNIKDSIYYLITVNAIIIAIFLVITRVLLGKERCIDYKIRRFVVENKIYLICVSMYFVFAITGEYLLIKRIGAYSIYYYILMLVLSIILLIVTMIKFKGSTEKLILFVIIVVSLLYISVSPVSHISWDEDSHLTWTVETSFFGNVGTTQADVDYKNANGHEFFFNKKTRIETINKLNNEYDNGYIKEESNDWISRTKIPYLFSGLLLFIGRSLNLPFTVLLRLGRFGFSLIYAIIAYCAVKKSDKAKLLISSILLLPTSIYMASNYNYDYWIIGFIILSYVYFFSELENKETLLNNRNRNILFTTAFIGILPKAIYFPLVLPYFLMPKRKFTDKKAYKKYILLLTIVLILLASYTVIPNLLATGGNGDLRGGADINLKEQLKYILSNPFSYIITSAKFAFNYLSIENAKLYTINYAYLGFGKFHYLLTFVVLMVSVITEKNNRNELKRIDKTMVITSVLLTIFLIITTFYLVFTPVGFYTVAGCQPRYLLPILFPLLYCLKNNLINWVGDIKKANTIVFSIMIVILLVGIFSVCIVRYY